MRLTNTILLTLLIGLCFSSCKKDCTGRYKISGKLYDNSADTPYRNARIFCSSVDEKNFSRDERRRLGLDTADENGYFEIFYNCHNDADFIEARYSFGSNNRLEKELPINTDYHEDIHSPSKGTGRVYLHSDNPVGNGNNDTLFIAYYDNVVSQSYIFDTITNTENRLYVEIRDRPNAGYTFYYSRSSKNFIQVPYTNRPTFRQGILFVDFRITGDPQVDEVIIKY